MALGLTLVGCKSSDVKVATKQGSWELPELKLEPGTRYIFFDETGARATTEPGEIHAVTAFGVLVFNSEATPVLPEGAEWAVNFHVDEKARVEPRDAAVLRAWAGASADWAGRLVQSRSYALAEEHPESDAAKEHAEQMALLKEQLKGVPGADKIQMGRLQRDRMTRWALAVRPKLEDFGLEEEPALKLIFVGDECEPCEPWRASQIPGFRVIEVESKDPALANLFSLVKEPPQIPAMLESGRLTVLPTLPKP